MSGMKHDDRAITMNISLQASLKHFVGAQVADCGYGSASDYMRELIRGAKRRLAGHEQLEQLLLQGLLAGPAKEWGSDDWTQLRKRVADKLSPDKKTG